MENQKKSENINPYTQPYQNATALPQEAEKQENVFDDDLSEGKNTLGQNPEQILYDKPENVEDASQIVSDGNDE